MGAENSNLRSIESLNSSLTEIEKRMFYLEGVKFHHERTGAVDDNLLIAGKLIRCNLRVDLLIGPMIGIVGCDFARIVVETELQEELTLNIFEVQRQHFDTPSFLYTLSIHTNSGVPTAATLQKLTPNTFYFVYVGGVNSNCTLTNYVLFRTLPTNPDYVRTLFLNNSRVDSNAVSNTSLWANVKTRCLDLFTIKEHKNKSGPAHLVIHTGNLLSVENILHENYAQVVDHLLSHNSSEDFLLTSIAQVEKEIRTLYRKALNNPSVRQISRHCGCIFLAGDGETGRGFSAQFNANEAEEVASPQYELKMQLLGLFMRIARRVCWSYLRQGWDTEYVALAADDSEREFFHKAILLTRMSITNRSRMQSSLKDCLENTRKEFGTEFHAYKEILTSSDALKADVQGLDQTLRQLSIKSSEYNTNHELHPNGGALHLGAVTVLLVEAGWGVVGEDGSVNLGLISAVNIHQQIFDDLQRVLSDSSLDNIRHSVIFATSTTLTTQETLEMRHYSLNRNQYSLSRNDAAPFTFAEVDVRKLLETLTLWQKLSTSYSVLLVEASNHQYAAKGVINAAVDPDQAAMAGLQYLRTGCMELPSSISWRDFDRFFLKHEDSDARLDTLKHSALVEYRGDSFWDVVFLPRSALILGSSASDGANNTEMDGTKLMQLECVIRESESATIGVISFGPSVGRITPTSVEIFVEFTTSGNQKIVCVDQVTGNEHLSVKFATAGRPVCFQFDHLQVNTSYDILTTKCGALPLCAGCFTTPKTIELFERPEDVQDDAHTLRILRENSSTKEPSPIATHQLVMYQSATLLLMGAQKSIVTKLPAEVLPPLSVVPSAAPTRAPTPLAASRVTTSSRPGTSDSRFAAQSVSSKQAVAGSVATSVSVSRPATAAAVEPVITQRAAAAHLVRDVLSQGWCGVDLTISFGSNVNWSTIVEPLILLLTKAEGEVISSFNTNQSASIGAYLNEAENVLRDAYRSNRSKSAEAGHSMGSHLTVASPLVEFLTVFEALFVASKGLSQYVFEQLNFLFNKVHSEYGSIYDKKLHSGPGPSHASHTHFMLDNSIMIFEIQPVLNHSIISPSHAFETQLYFLSRELSFFGSSGGSGRNDSRIMTLIVTSPLPVVTDDETASEMTFNSSTEDSRHHFAFTVNQSLQLLDLVASWLEVSCENRRCVMLCGGVDSGFTTTIDIRTQSTDVPSTPLSHNGSTRSLSRSGKQHSRHMSRVHRGGISITQICCAFNTGPKDSHQLRTDGQLNSATRKFSYVHAMHSMGCGVVEIPVLTAKPRDIIYTLQPLEQPCAVLFETHVFKRPHFPVSPLSLQLQDCLEFLYLHSIPPGCVHDKVPDKVFAFLGQIKAFVASVALREQDVFKKCHAHYCTSNSLSEGRSDVEDTFVALNHWLISRLPLKYQKVCKQPSRFVIRVVWHFVSKMFSPSPINTAPSVVTAPTETAGGSVSALSGKVHMLAMLFRTDYAQFTRFVQTTIETQLFIEYLAATFSDDVNN